MTILIKSFLLENKHKNEFGKHNNSLQAKSSFWYFYKTIIGAITLLTD